MPCMFVYVLVACCFTFGAWNLFNHFSGEVIIILSVYLFFLINNYLKKEKQILEYSG